MLRKPEIKAKLSKDRIVYATRLSERLQVYQSKCVNGIKKLKNNLFTLSDSRELFIKKKIFERVGFSFVTWKPPFGS